MNKLDILYKDKKNQIYNYYREYKNINNENIQDVNDIIVDKKLKKDDFENSLMEFYITLSMCMYMIENDLYDEYFFTTYAELLSDYKDGKFDNYYKDILFDKEFLESDISDINEYIKKDKIKSKYYDDVSDLYNNKFEKFEEEIEEKYNN